MQLYKYISPIDKKAILVYLLAVFRLFGMTMIAPLVMSLVFMELTYSWTFGALAAIFYLLGYFGSKWLKYGKELELKEALAVTALSYLLFGLAGAIPFLYVTPFINGFFEAMSGFTTTGLTVVNVADLPKALLFFRSYSQWIGGAGIIILSLAILLRPGQAAFKLYSIEFGQENIVGSVIATARVVAKIYLLLTLLGFLAFIASGMGIFDGLLHVMSTLSTGGFSPYHESIGHYNSLSTHLVVIVFMLVGAISFPLYYIARVGGIRRFFRDIQLRYLVTVSLLAALLFLISFSLRPGNVVAGLFQAVTSITTTGFNTVETVTLPDSAKMLTIVLMIIGGGTGSTAGGIKLFRFIILIGLLRWLILRPMLPEEAKVPIKYGNLGVTEGELRMVFGFLLLYLGVLLVSTLLFLYLGYSSSFTAALFEVASAEGTVGLSVGVTSSSLPAPAKLILIFDMWVGRLEIIPVLIMLYPRIWAKLRR